MTARILLVLAILFIIGFSLIPRTAYALLGSELLPNPWILKASQNAQERYQLIDPNALKGKTALRLRYNLHGTCLLGGDASALIIDQPFGKSWRYVSVSNYGRNCLDGEQTVDIPLSNFQGLDLSKPVGTFHIRIWYNKPYNIEIKSSVVYNPQTDIVQEPSGFGRLLDKIVQPKTITINSPSPSIAVILTKFISPTLIIRPSPVFTVTLTPTPSLTPTPVAVPSLITPTLPRLISNRASWSIQSVSSMKETKDRICNQRNSDFIKGWVNQAVELGVNFISIETPYENPNCGNAIKYTADWIGAIRDRSLKVWHRHMPLGFEGIYGVSKNKSIDYLRLMSDYIKTNKSLFAEGDIFTPIPEPQNGGIAGVTYCAQSICQFQSAAQFNQWLRDAMDSAEAAFGEIGLGGKIKIGYFGFDGFVAWGDNNPDWHGILEDKTVLKMGNITIDHYPEIVGDTMANDLNELETRYPNFPIIIGEWGTISGGNVVAQVLSSMQAARRPSVVGFNYWHLGPGGNEALITEQFTHNLQYDQVQKFYKYANSL